MTLPARVTTLYRVPFQCPQAIRLAVAMSFTTRVSFRAKQKPSLASWLSHSTRSKRRWDWLGVLKGALMRCSVWPLISLRQINVATPTLFSFRNLRMRPASSWLSTKMLSRAGVLLLMATSQASGIRPKSPSRPMMPVSLPSFWALRSAPSTPPPTSSFEFTIALFFSISSVYLASSDRSPSSCCLRRSCSTFILRLVSLNFASPASTRSSFSLSFLSVYQSSACSRGCSLGLISGWLETKSAFCLRARRELSPSASLALSSESLPSSPEQPRALSSASDLLMIALLSLTSLSIGGCFSRMDSTSFCSCSISLATSSDFSSAWLRSFCAYSRLLCSSLSRTEFLLTCSLQLASCAFIAFTYSWMCFTSSVTLLCFIMFTRYVARTSSLCFYTAARLRACSSSSFLATCMASWASTLRIWQSALSFLTTLTALFLASSMPRASPSTNFMRSPFSWRCSSTVSSRSARSSILRLNSMEPMMVSRYYSSPGLSGSPLLGFIWEMSSTQPCRMRNRLLVRSMPSRIRASLTSAWVDSAPSRKYLLTLAWFTVRFTVKAGVRSPESSRCANCTSTPARCTSPHLKELWISWLSLLSRIQEALNPKMKSRHSMRLDLPEPFGPTTLENWLWKGPTSTLPAQDLKFSMTMEWMMSLRPRPSSLPPKLI